MTMTTRPMVSTSSNSTSSTEARMVTVRSVRTVNLTEEGSDGCNLRQQLLDGVDHGDDVGAGLALDVDDDGRRRVFIQAACRLFSVSSITLATSESRTGAPLR